MPLPMSNETRANAGTNSPRPARPTGRRFEQRRRQVLDASVQYFFEKGYEGASLLDIAEEVGLLKGSLYYYAKSKEDLLFAIVEEVYAESVEAAAELRASTAAPIDKLERSLTRAVLYLLEHRREVVIYFHDAKSLSEERLALLQPNRTAWARALNHVLREGQRSGDFRDDLDTRLASTALIGSINWLALQDPEDSPSPATRARFVQKYCRQLMSSVVVPAKAVGR
jgi:AcrR family transcriptional regulator